MKKLAKIFASLIVAVVVGSFLLSMVVKKYHAQRNVSLKKETTAQRVSTSEVDAVFYNAVGASPKPLTSTIKRQSTRFTIELAHFNNQADAEDLLMKLKGKGIDGFYTPMRRGGTVIYRVRLGMFANPDDAKKVMAKVSAATKVNGVVTKLQ